MISTKKNKRRRHRFMSGEDIDMFREKESERKSKHQDSICDENIDGA